MSWERVRGHEAQAEAFARAVRRGRLAHAYLFVGPPGVGKRLFAVELAKALLCEARPDATASRRATAARPAPRSRPARTPISSPPPGRRNRRYFRSI